MLRYALILLYVLISPGGPLITQTATEIIGKAEDLLKGETSQGVFKMTIVTPNYTRVMEMETFWKGNEKALIHINAPRREAGNKTLKIGNEMWMYLRNTETTIKIPPSMMLQSWNGSDFTNDDLVRESNLIDDYRIKIIGEEKVENALCWVIELIPEEEIPSVWGKLHYLVRQNDFLPARIDYYDEHGKLIRSMEFSNIGKYGGRSIPGTWTMYNNVKPGNYTQFEILDIGFDVHISDRIFSLQELQR
jgi:outer membrane lipoprotein-sorting protein